MLRSLLRRNLLGRYPTLAIALAVSAAKTAFLYSAWVLYGKATYQVYWIALQPVELLLQSAITIDGIYHIMRHFKKSRWIGTATTGVFGGFSGGLVLISAGVLSPQWIDPRIPVVDLSKCFTLICAGTLLANWAFHSIPRIARRDNVKMLLSGIGTYLFMDWLGMLLIRASKGNYWWIAAGQNVIAVGVIAACWYWLRMRSSGEAWEDAGPTPGLLEKLESRERAAVEIAKDAG